jgi:SAM-dependent methyltransferase
MSFHDHFSSQADRYTQFRPDYGPALFTYLAGLVTRHDLAWDCGTGSGQAAVALANDFSAVVATDPSARQVAHARQHSRVQYLVARAEDTPLADQSVDLVTVAQAVHWFDRPRFYQEVRRVGREGSVLALWAYGLATISPQVDAVVAQLYEPILGRYWPPERKLIEERYATIDFPFEELATPAFEMTAHWNLGQLEGYLGTWSSVEKYRAANGTNPLTLVDRELREAWGDPELAHLVRWPLYLRAGRIR